MQIPSLGGDIPWGRAWESTPVFLSGESHGQRSLAGYRPQGYKELDMTEGLTLTLFLHACPRGTAKAGEAPVEGVMMV